MEYRNIGNSDLQVSVVGLGCNNFGMRIGDEGAQAVVDKAIELGVNFFDTAEMYAGEHGASEAILGKAIGDRRGDVVIATKFGMPTAMTPAGIQSPGSGTREYITNALNNSLDRLGTDYIDLYMVHFPDPDTPAEETAGVLDDLVKEGKIRHAGISNVNGDQIREAKQVTESNGFAPYISVENEWSLVDRNIEAEAAPARRRVRLWHLSLLPPRGWFPHRQVPPGRGDARRRTPHRGRPRRPCGQVHQRQELGHPPCRGGLRWRSGPLRARPCDRLAARSGGRPQRDLRRHPPRPA